MACWSASLALSEASLMPAWARESVSLIGLAVGRGQLIEFVDAVADRLGLALHILLAGEGIDASPEAFARRGGQRALPVALPVLSVEVD